MLTPDEQAEFDALKSELLPKSQGPKPREIAQSRTPGDLSSPKMSLLTPDEEAELNALQSEFYQPQNAPIVEEKSVLSQIGEGLDTYSGAAPLRKAIGTFQDTNSLSQAGSAFIDQFSQSPDLAPTGKQIAEKAGFSTDSMGTLPAPSYNGRTPVGGYGNQAKEIQLPSSAGVIGLGADMALDPTNLIPFVAVGKLGTKGAKMALKGSAAADSFITGGKLTKVGEIAADSGKVAIEAANKVKKAIIKSFNPGVADDYNEMAQTAAEIGVDKDLINDSIIYGEKSVPAGYERNIAEGPMGGELTAKHEKLIHTVSDSTENEVAKIGGGSVAVDDFEAGSLIRQSYDEGVDRFFDSMGETYGNAIKMSPGMRLDKNSNVILSRKINELESWANRRIGETDKYEKVIDSVDANKSQIKKATGEMLNVLDSTNKGITKVQRQQAKEVLNAVRIMKNAIATSGGDLAQVYSAMRDIGDVAFKSKNTLADVPSDVRKFQEMYFMLQKGMTESIRSGLGDDFADALIKNNSDMSEFFTKRGVIADSIGNKSLSDESLFKSLVLAGDSKKLEALRSIVSTDSWNKLRGTYLDRNIIRNADGVINFGATRKKFDGLRKSGKLRSIVSDSELLSIGKRLHFGDRAGIGRMSTSGTGSSAKFSNIPETVKNFIGGETLVENIKNSTRKNYIEVPSKTANGQDYVQLLKSPPVKETKKTGIQLLRENSPISKKQGAQGARLNSIQERNEKINKIKKLRGY